MHYFVKAKFKKGTEKEFLKRLTDGSIQSQQPDGLEIVRSMEKAVIYENVATWGEICFCPTPLAHEIATVYKYFFEDIETNNVPFKNSDKAN